MLDQPWTRTPAALLARGLIIRRVFGAIIDHYADQRVLGAERLLELAPPAIFVANHCSHVDTPVLLRSLPAAWRRRTVVAAAADYFYTRRALASAVSLAFGTVPLERSSRDAGAQANAHLDGLITDGWSVVLFAEGTRSRDGRVGVLRSGAAVLAARHGVPIVPVHIAGTHRAMPPGSNWMIPQRIADGGRLPHTIRVTIGLPMQTNATAEPLAVMESVRLFMAACGAETTPDPRLPTRVEAVA